jgi:hypothetical protein
MNCFDFNLRPSDKVAQHENEHLLASRDEARERSAATDVERSSAQREANELREGVSRLEAEMTKLCAENTVLEGSLVASREESDSNALVGPAMMCSRCPSTHLPTLLPC